MEFLRARRHKTRFSEFIYLLLNITLAVAILAVVLSTQSPLPAFALVLLSKWRIFAVRPRYWFAHIQANMVDLIVSLGFVQFLYMVTSTPGAVSNNSVTLQIFLTVLYIAWLLYVKPRSKRVFIGLQAGIAIFVGTTALFSVAYSLPAFVTVAAMWLIGFAAARHVLTSYDEAHLAFLSLVWGLVFAEIGWIAYHWTITYSMPFLGTLLVPQVAIMMSAISFVAAKLYGEFAHKDTVRLNDVLLPCLLAAGVIFVMLIMFNDATTTL